MTDKKVSSVITIGLFFSLLLVTQIIGKTFIQNEDIVAIFSYSLTFLGVFTYFKSRGGHINIKFKELEIKKVLKVLFYCCSYFIVCNIFINFLVFNLHFNINKFSILFTPSSHTFLGQFLFLVSLTICPAILEEFVFRSVLFKNLVPKHGLKSAIIVTTFLFSFSHGITNGLVLFFCGGYFYITSVYYKEKNLLYPIIFHFFGNLLCSIPHINKIQPIQSISIYLLLAFIVVLPFVLINLNKIFILNKNTFEV